MESSLKTAYSHKFMFTLPTCRGECDSDNIFYTISLDGFGFGYDCGLWTTIFFIAIQDKQIVLLKKHLPNLAEEQRPQLT